MDYNRATYTLYRYGEYIGEGTAVELSKIAGISPITIKKTATPSYQKKNKKWVAKRAEEYIDKDNIKREVIRGLMDEHGYTFKELGAVIGLNLWTLWSKVNGDSRFLDTELAEIEDLFFLEEGELIHGED